ncbi:MAG: B12-binding domain-containing radical SAM protein, partial [Firmicutes bacterium]|nr:B12-binding domain-containing radical SAM protein [Bacillota bacterium]
MIEHHPFRVALVRAFSRADEKELAEPLGIEALAAILRKNDIACRLFDRERDSMADIVEQIVAYNPSLLGLSVLMEDNALDAARLLLKIRQRLAVPCVIGGLFVTASYEQARAIFPKDCYLVRGEGETALLKICAAINGLTYPEMEKPYLLPEEWPWLYRYHLQDYLNLGAPINMKSSRGCPGQCRFCATPSLPDGLNRWRGRKIADVADEMEHLSKLYYPPAFNFVDDDFGPLSRVAELTEELKKRNVRCAFSLQLRAAAVYNTPNYAGIIRKLQAGGLCGVFIGVESFDAKTLAYFNKPLDPFEALRAAQSFRACGMAVNVGYLLWPPLA